MFNTRKLSLLFLFFALMASPVFAQEMDKKEDQKKVSNAELTKFANAFQSLQDANRAAQKEMVKVVEKHGLTMKRFNEIHVAYINPNIKGDATEEELKKHHAAMNEIEVMQQDLQNQMDALVEKSGLTTQKYQQIAQTMREDKQLQKEYMKMVNPDTDSVEKE